MVADIREAETRGQTGRPGQGGQEDGLGYAKTGRSLYDSTRPIGFTLAGDPVGVVAKTISDGIEETNRSLDLRLGPGGRPCGEVANCRGLPIQEVGRS